MTAPVQVGPAPSGGGPAPSSDWNDLVADIGDRIRAERKARRLTETDLAHRAGLDRATVRRIQDGVGTLRAFAQVCHGLGVRMDYILSPEWRLPTPRPSLEPRQLQVLREAAGGKSLAVVGDRLGMERTAVASYLSQVYRRLEVAHLPQGERRTAAVLVAKHYGLLDTAKRTS